jgi:hypothetical protein
LGLGRPDERALWCWAWQAVHRGNRTVASPASFTKEPVMY